MRRRRRRRREMIGNVLAVIGVMAVVAAGAYVMTSLGRGAMNMVWDKILGEIVYREEHKSDAERLPSIPEELWDHIYLENRGNGACESLTGDVLLTVIFVDDDESVWTEEEKQAVKAMHTEEIAVLTGQAQQFGASLHISVNYMETATAQCFSSEDYMVWAEDVLREVGLPKSEEVISELKEQYGVKEAPVVFYMNRAGRAFALQSTAADAFECSFLYRNEANFRHELNHLFGAEDYYYPESVKKIAEQYFSDSVMMEASGTEADSLTAYLIGWTDTADKDALAFLYGTSDLTREQLEEENKKELFTGTGTKRIGEGVYTGDLVDGMAQGQGKMIWDSGVTYEGEWESNRPHGKGKMVWTDGTTYEGDFFENQIQGYGTMTWPSGNSYTGEWLNGERHGTGTQTFYNGVVKSGIWEHNEFLES